MWIFSPWSCMHAAWHRPIPARQNSDLGFTRLLLDQGAAPVLSRLCRSVCSCLKRTTSLSTYQCDDPTAYVHVQNFVPVRCSCCLFFLKALFKVEKGKLFFKGCLNLSNLWQHLDTGRNCITSPWKKQNNLVERVRLDINLQALLVIWSNNTWTHCSSAATLEKEWG